MSYKIEKFEASDGLKINAFIWDQVEAGKVKAMVQLHHGMAEYALRYDRFARYLNNNGYLVCSVDMRGHGHHITEGHQKGFFAETKGWEQIIDDYSLLNQFIRKKYPDVPVVLMGHSMGSFFARAFFEKHGGAVDAMILSGTAFYPAAMIASGKILATLQRFFAGPRHHSSMLHAMAFKAHNNRFKPAKTPVDWLSRDHESCKSYHHDELCGFVCTTAFYQDLFRLLSFIQQKNLYNESDKDIPVLLLSGSMDAVGNFGKGPELCAKFFRENGFRNVSLKLYDQGRHEMLNETNRDDVYHFITSWLDKRYARNG